MRRAVPRGPPPTDPSAGRRSNSGRILVEYLYTGDFWAQGDPEAGASKHDSATKLAQVYLLADKYDLEGMKDVVTRKMRKYTELENPPEWLSVAEIIYAATPESDRRYPRFSTCSGGRFPESRADSWQEWLFLHSHERSGERRQTSSRRLPWLSNLLEGPRARPKCRVAGGPRLYAIRESEP